MGCCCGTKKEEVEEPQPVQPQRIQQEPKESKEQIILKFKNTVGHSVAAGDWTQIQQAMNQGFQPDWPFQYEGEEVTILILTVLFKKQLLFEQALKKPQNLYVEVGEEHLNVMYFILTSGTIENYKMIVREGYDINRPIGQGQPSAYDYVQERTQNTGFMDPDDDRLEAIRKLME